ncbi:ParB/RepB/Spo0J family partition protein [Treponema sp. OMZ 855]|uniref:ParB/RepB/Spo0J family partition protein n=1 Tax=Treponema sp. OMZ 855 TaxID=1643512 RepID=UPI0020A2CF0C|nr:ParB/RepB/Spo0J family partition protein [Treponema sp. OMZ 855]UTC51026.1 ParB/RepB/Spo0J family partition protein [Treponema sp. OMZ 855]
MASMQRIAIKDIAIDDDRHIGGKGSLETLKSSIEKVGLINPITVRKGKDEVFPYAIIAGRRRIEAAILLDWTEIDAVVYEADEVADDSYFTHVALAENVNRLDLHPLDEGAQYARLLKEGYSLEDLAAYFDRSISHIYQRIKLCNLIEDAREIFRDGQIKISTAAKIASLPKQVQKEIVSALKKELQWAGDHEKTIDRVIRQMMRMPLDFPCEACEQCTAKRTHYGNAALFPEYHDRSDYCMDSRCYEKNIRGFYQKTVSEFLKNWSDAKTVYIYEEDKEKAEYLRSILEKKPLIDAIPVHVYHESFEDCSTIRILDEDETDAVYSSSKEVLKQRDIIPVLYPQYGMYQEPVFYIAVDDASYEEIFSSDSNEAEKAAGSDEAVESNGCDTGGDTDSRYTDGDNQKENASGAEQAAEEAVDARDWQTLTPRAQAEAFKRIFLEYLQLERDNIHHPFFYLPAFRHIMEIHVHFKEAFQIVTGTSLQDFYQQKRYEDLTYQQLLELYVYADIIERMPYHFHRLKVVNGIPVVKATDLKTDPWRALCADVLYHFLQERTNAATGKTEKKTAATADTSA